jgi:hypothetical protein
MQRKRLLAMAKSKDIYWVRSDVFKNSVTLPVWVWDQHASKHAFDKYPASEDHIYQTIVDPDYAHRSLDPFVLGEGCVFEKFFEAEQQRFLVPVLYEDITVSEEYELGGKKGRVMTGFFPGKPNNSKHVGATFWKKKPSNTDSE